MERLNRNVSIERIWNVSVERFGVRCSNKILHVKCFNKVLYVELFSQKISFETLSWKVSFKTFEGETFHLKPLGLKRLKILRRNVLFKTFTWTTFIWTIVIERFGLKLLIWKISYETYKPQDSMFETFYLKFLHQKLSSERI